MATLELENLSKTFANGTKAVVDLSFEVQDREAVFLLGPSGAGKTTTLRMCAGLEDPDSGAIRISGKNIVPLPPGPRNVAMVYDKHSLFPHLSVYENMAYPLRVRKMPEDQMRKRIMAVAETLQIQQLVERMPGQLSGGQMQRVAIGRALVRDADVYLMDEPISHLDAQLRARMRLEFKRLQKEFNATILYVSHDQLEAMTMSDRIVVMNKGVVEQIGPPQEIFDRPATRFVATFVGEPSMNILPTTLVEKGNKHWLEVGTSILPIDQSWASKAVSIPVQARFELGVRPQHLRLAPATDRHASVVHGTIFAVETLGSRVIFDITVGESLVRVMTSVDEAMRHPRSIGSPVGVKLDPDVLYLFDKSTGRTVAQAMLAEHAAQGGKQNSARKNLRD
jgi:ABC-type sugar transport system ATPase subunit